MHGMQLVRRRNVSDLHCRIGAQLLHARVCPAAEVALELRARFGARVGGSGQFDARVGRERRRHQRERATEAGNAEADCFHSGRGGIIIAGYLGT